jgi:hypothetical protein
VRRCSALAAGDLVELCRPASARSSQRVKLTGAVGCITLRSPVSRGGGRCTLESTSSHQQAIAQLYLAAICWPGSSVQQPRLEWRKSCYQPGVGLVLVAAANALQRRQLARR